MRGRQTTAADLIAHATANDYKRGAHREHDEMRHREKHVKKTKRDQDAKLKRYVIWYLAGQRDVPGLDEEGAREQCLRPGMEDPDLATAKDFLRFYIATSRPRLTENPTVDSINAVAE